MPSETSVAAAGGEPGTSIKLFASYYDPVQVIKTAWYPKSLWALKTLHHAESHLVSEFTNTSFSSFSWRSPSPHTHSGSPFHLLHTAECKTYGKSPPQLIPNPRILPTTWSLLPSFNQIWSTLQQQILVFNAMQNQSQLPASEKSF